MNQYHIIKYLGLILFTFSCAHRIDFEEIIKKEKQFKLKVHPSGGINIDSSLTTTINADSELIDSLKFWFKNNPDNWNSSITSWTTPKLSLIGNDFKLLVFNDWVVVSFSDKSGKQRQYTKRKSPNSRFRQKEIIHTNYHQGESLK